MFIKMLLLIVFASQFHVFHENLDFRFFCTPNSLRHELMFWLEGAEVEGSNLEELSSQQPLVLLD